MSQHQGGVNTSFIGIQDATFGPISSPSGSDLQVLAVAGQLPVRSLATLQAAGFARPTLKSGLSKPMIDQGSVFNLDNSKSKIVGGQQQQQPNPGNSKQMNLLHGIPTTMEPKQLANLHQSFQNMNSMQVPRSQGNSILMLPTNMGQPITSNGPPGGLLPGNRPAENERVVGGYTNPLSQTTSSSSLTFPMNHVTELPGTDSFHPLRSAPGIPYVIQKGPFQDSDANWSVTGGFIQGYHMPSDLQHIRSHDWELRNVGLSFDSPQSASSLPRNLESSAASLFVQQEISRSGFVRDPSTGRGSTEGLPMEGTNHQNLSSAVNSSLRIKSENVIDASSPNTLFPDHFSQEDLMSALLKQVRTFEPHIPH